MSTCTCICKKRRREKLWFQLRIVQIPKELWALWFRKRSPNLHIAPSFGDKNTHSAHSWYLSRPAVVYFFQREHRILRYFCPFQPILAFFGVLLTGLNSVVVHQNWQISGMTLPVAFNFRISDWFWPELNMLIHQRKLILNWKLRPI